MGVGQRLSRVNSRGCADARPRCAKMPQGAGVTEVCVELVDAHKTGPKPACSRRCDLNQPQSVGVVLELVRALRIEWIVRAIRSRDLLPPNTRAPAIRCWNAMRMFDQVAAESPTASIAHSPKTIEYPTQ